MINRLFFLILGLAGLVIQMVLLRQAGFALYGNELSVGVGLAVWLVSNGLGVAAADHVIAKKQNSKFQIPNNAQQTNKQGPSCTLDIGICLGFGSLKLGIAVIIAIAGLVIATPALLVLLPALRTVLAISFGALPTPGQIVALTVLLIALPAFIQGTLYTIACALSARDTTDPRFRGDDTGGKNTVAHTETHTLSFPRKRESADILPDIAGGSLTRNRVYLWETAGACLGGVLFTFVGTQLSPFLMMGSANVALVVTAMAAFLTHRNGCHPERIPPQTGSGRQTTVYLLAAALLGLSLLSILFSSRLDALSDARLFHPLPVLDHVRTPHGETVIVATGAHDRAVYANGALTDANSNERGAEELALYGATLMSAPPRQVLLIGGGLLSLAPSLEQLTTGTVTIVQPDKKTYDTLLLSPDALRASEVGPGRSKSVRNPVFADPRHFIERTPERFDYICLAITQPATLELNRFFTAEFYASVARVLTPEGVFTCMVPSSENLINDDTAAMLSLVRATLATAFSQVLAIPGDTVIFVASNRAAPLVPDATAMATVAGAWPFAPAYVNDYYLVDRLSPERAAYLAERLAAVSGRSRSVRDTAARTLLERPETVNTDLMPQGFFHALVLLSQKTSPALKRLFTTAQQVPFVYVAGAFVLVSIAVKWFSERRTQNAQRMTFFILTLGFTEISLEIVAILLYQTWFGNMYQWLALLVACYMAGIVLGSVGTRQRLNLQDTQERLRGISMTMSLLCVGLIACALVISNAPSSMLKHPATLFALLALAGFLGGRQFCLANNVDHRSKPQAISSKLTAYSLPLTAFGTIYSLDMLGSAAGALITTLALLPLYGIVNTLFLLVILNLIAVVPAPSAKQQIGQTVKQ